MLNYLIAGITLGTVAGISPGPLLVMVITETIKHGYKKGIKMAFVPIVSDLPIVLLSIFLVYKISDFDLILAIISFLGAGFLIYLAIENIQIKRVDIDTHTEKWKGFSKGVLVNFLSPHPYLFWILVGAPLSIKAYNENFAYSALFITGFYVFLIGAKVAVAYISHKSKTIFSSNKYLIVIKVLGFVLVLFAIILIKDGLEFLNLL